MKTKEIITSSSNFHNPFEGRKPDEVWNELKSKSKPIDKEKILNKLSSELNKKK